MAETFMLGVADYVILGIALAVSAGTGLYFPIFGGKQTSKEEYFFAGRNMPVFTVAFSLMSTEMSAIALMGYPGEIYMHGTLLAFAIIGFVAGPIIHSFLFLPIYFKTGILTTYEYLEKRFGKSTRWILSMLFLVRNLLYCGICLYPPALAMSAVTNLSLWPSVILIGSVCTFYCTLGGMKAVLWTDVFQSFLMYTCLLAIAVKGILDLGLRNIFRTAYLGGRLLVPTFELDFSRLYTMWNLALKETIAVLYFFGTSQVMVQRQLTLKSLRRSQLAILLSSLMLTAFILLCCLCGIIFYVHFKECDPITSPTKPIQSEDQLMPYYISLTMRQYPGLPGLCIAGIFSAAFSSFSSVINSMATVTHQDIISALWPNDSSSVLITKIASLCYGVLGILMSFLLMRMGTLIQTCFRIAGLTTGPMLGVYLLAALTRTTNEVGVNLGVLTAFFFAGCVTFIPNERHYPKLPVESNCSDPTENMRNVTTLTDDTTYSFADVQSEVTTTNNLPDNFPFSFMWIPGMTLLVCLLIGYFGSWIYSAIRGYSKPVSTDLLSPVVHWFTKEGPEVSKESTRKEITEVLTTTKF